MKKNVRFSELKKQAKSTAELLIDSTLKNNPNKKLSQTELGQFVLSNFQYFLMHARRGRRLLAKDVNEYLVKRVGKIDLDDPNFRN